MIIWNLNKWGDRLLIEHSEEELRELFAWALQRRKFLLSRKQAGLK